MGDRHDHTDTDHLGEPRYSYTEEETLAAPPEEPGDEATVVAGKAPPLAEEQGRARARKAAAIGTVAGILVGALLTLVAVALAGGDAEPGGDAQRTEELESALEDRDARIEALDAQAAEYRAAVEERDAELERLRQQVGEEESDLAEQQTALQERSAALERRAAALDEREQALDERERVIAEREDEPRTPDPGEDGVPTIDDEDAEALVERIVDRIRELFE